MPTASKMLKREILASSASRSLIIDDEAFQNRSLFFIVGHRIDLDEGSSRPAAKQRRY
jgi:hypothetical protein